MRYVSRLVIQDESQVNFKVQREAARPFTDFAVMAKSSRELTVIFSPVAGPNYHAGNWHAGDYSAELFIKYASQSELSSVKRVNITVGSNEFAALNADSAMYTRICPPSWDFCIT